MLKLTLSLPPQPDFSLAASLPGLSEILVEPQGLARSGAADLDQVCRNLSAIKDLGLKATLAWDLLATDLEIADGIAFLKKLDLSSVHAIRVQDPGIAFRVREVFPDLPLQLILETGNHNAIGIQSWCRHLKPQRIMVSNEIPLSSIQEIGRVIDRPLEMLVLGRIEIFYTPRHLISPVQPGGEAPLIESMVTDEETQKSFPLVENETGTIMYYEKELFLLPFLTEVESAGVNHARLDLKFYSQEKVLPAVKRYLREPNTENRDLLKSLLGKKLTRGFFKSNRTDKQFAKLKNPHLGKREHLNFVGTVLETKRKGYLVVQAEGRLFQGQALRIVVPEGSWKTHQVVWVRNVEGNSVQKTNGSGVWLINPCPGISSGSKVYCA